MTEPARRQRRELLTVSGFCLLDAAAAFAAAAPPWAHATVRPPAPLPPRMFELAAPDSVRALAVVGIAGAVAVIAARGWARMAVGVVVMAAGIGIVLAALTYQPELPDGVTASVVNENGWWLLAAVTGALLAVGGLATAVRGRDWATLSRRYEPPAPTATVASPREALDRGEDPTR
ncbi:MAG TPA: Trp biosynthesis-associated membrane protein [Mycobacteriales bacterium]|nr:Trp biosynthesis-associated membrane protein [Mycobacteriales bacterium]